MSLIITGFVIGVISTLVTLYVVVAACSKPLPRNPDGTVMTPDQIIYEQTLRRATNEPREN